MKKANTVLSQPSELENTDHPSVETHSRTPTQPDHTTAPPVNTGEKAIDRWFHEQRGNKTVPKKLELPNEVLVVNGGPLKMIGNITLIDEEGNVSYANELKLCRCGGSNNKPLCDEQHLDIEFFDNGNIQKLSDCMPVKRPQKVTLTFVKNGPIKFRGFLRVYNTRGQEFSSMNGALCRCGRSSNKPFCDNNPGCAGC